MTKVSLDKATLSKLHGLRSQVEFYDDSGRKLGVFIPAADHASYEGVDVLVTSEELSRRELETRLYSTQEVLSRLGGLERSS